MNGQPITIHQFHFTATAGDAVTQHMLFVRAALQEGGIGGEIFVGENRAPQGYQIRSFQTEKLWNSDLILVHHSHGNPLQRELLKLDIPQALVYHNVTPASFFDHDPTMKRLCIDGRRQLSAFIPRVVAAFGVSRYNCAELEALGFQKPVVFPLLDLSQPPLPRPAARPQPSDRLDWLFIGKLTPHKNQARLVEIQAALENRFPGKYRLTLAGRCDPLYAEYLRLLAKKLGVETGVVFAGRVTPLELEALYARSRALVCASLHEGFCVPLVEAMQRELPVFAVPTTGVRETLGKAGVRLVSQHLGKTAEAIDAVLSDSAAVASILERQSERLQELSAIQNPERVRALCMGLVERLRLKQHAAPGEEARA